MSCIFFFLVIPHGASKFHSFRPDLLWNAQGSTSLNTLLFSRIGNSNHRNSIADANGVLIPLISFVQGRAVQIQPLSSGGSFACFFLPPQGVQKPVLFLPGEAYLRFMIH